MTQYDIHPNVFKYLTIISGVCIQPSFPLFHRLHTIKNINPLMVAQRWFMRFSIQNLMGIMRFQGSLSQPLTTTTFSKMKIFLLLEQLCTTCKLQPGEEVLWTRFQNDKLSQEINPQKEKRIYVCVCVCVYESSNSVKYTMNVQTPQIKITNSRFMTNTKCAENEHKL